MKQGDFSLARLVEQFINWLSDAGSQDLVKRVFSWAGREVRPERGVIEQALAGIERGSLLQRQQVEVFAEVMGKYGRGEAEKFVDLLTAVSPQGKIAGVLSRYREFFSKLQTGEVEEGAEIVPEGTWKRFGKEVTELYERVMRSEYASRIAQTPSLANYLSGVYTFAKMARSGKMIPEVYRSVVGQTDLLQSKNFMGIAVQMYTSGLYPLATYLTRRGYARPELEQFVAHMFFSEQGTMIAGYKRGGAPVLAQMMSMLGAVSELPSDLRDVPVGYELFNVMYETLFDNSVKVIAQTLGQTEQEVAQNLSQLLDLFKTRDVMRIHFLYRHAGVYETIAKLTGESVEDIEKLYGDLLHEIFAEQEGETEILKRYLQALPGWLERFKQSASYQLGKPMPDLTLQDVQSIYYGEFLHKAGLTHLFGRVIRMQSISSFARSMVKEGEGLGPTQPVQDEALVRQYLDQLVRQRRLPESPKQIKWGKYVKQLRAQVESEISTVAYHYGPLLSVQLGSAVGAVLTKRNIPFESGLDQLLRYLSAPGAGKAEDALNQLLEGLATESEELQDIAKTLDEIATNMKAGTASKLASQIARQYSRTLTTEVLTGVAFPLGKIIRTSQAPYLAVRAYTPEGQALPIKEIMAHLNILQRGLGSQVDITVRTGGARVQFTRLAQRGIVSVGGKAPLTSETTQSLFARFATRYYRPISQALDIIRSVRKYGAETVERYVEHIPDQTLRANLEAQLEFQKAEPKLTELFAEYGPFQFKELFQIIESLQLTGARPYAYYGLVQLVQPSSPTPHVYQKLAQAAGRFAGDILAGRGEQVEQQIARLNAQQKFPRQFTLEDALRFLEDVMHGRRGPLSEPELVRAVGSLFGLSESDIDELVRQITANDKQQARKAMNNFIRAISESMEAVASITDYASLLKITNLKRFSVPITRGVFGEILPRPDILTLASPNTIASVVAETLRNQPFAGVKALNQISIHLEEAKRTVGTGFVEHAEVRFVDPRKLQPGMKKLYGKLVAFHKRSQIPMEQSEEILERYGPELVEQIRGLGVNIPTLLLDEGNFRKFLTRLAEEAKKRGLETIPSVTDVPHSTLGDQYFYTQDLLNMLEQRVVTERGQQWVKLPEELKITGFHRQKGMGNLLRMQLEVELDVGGQTVRVPVLALGGMQEKRLNKMMHTLGILQASKQLGIKTGDASLDKISLDKVDLQQLQIDLFERASQLAPYLKPTKIIARVGGHTFEVSDVEGLLISHRTLFNLQQDFSAGIQSIRRISEQAQLTSYAARQFGVVPPAYDPTTVMKLTSLTESLKVAKQLKSVKQIVFGNVVFKAGTASAQTIEEDEQYLAVENALLTLMKSTKSKSLRQLYENTIIFQRLLRSQIYQDYVTTAGRYVPVSDLQAIPGIQKFIELLQQGKPIRVFLGETGGQTLYIDLQSAFYLKSEAGDLSTAKLIFSDIGNQLRQYYFQLGSSLRRGKPTEDLFTSARQLSRRFAQQIQYQWSERMGIGVVGRFKTLAKGQLGQSLPKKRVQALWRILQAVEQALEKGEELDPRLMKRQFTQLAQFQVLTRAGDGSLVLTLPKMLEEAPDVVKAAQKSFSLMLSENVTVQYIEDLQQIKLFRERLETMLKAGDLTQLSFRSYGVFTREPQMLFRPIVEVAYLSEQDYIGLPAEIAELMGGDDDADLVQSMLGLFIDNAVLQAKAETNPVLKQILERKTAGQLDIPSVQVQMLNYAASLSDAKLRGQISRVLHARMKASYDLPWSQKLKALFEKLVLPRNLTEE